MTDDIMTRVWEAYWPESDDDAKRGTQAALERVVCIVREEQSARIAALEAENADLRSGEYLVRVIEERERLRKALEPFALISMEGLVSDDVYTTVTTCSSYFHTAATVIREAKP